jgi:hypothetical protein
MPRGSPRRIPPNLELAPAARSHKICALLGVGGAAPTTRARIPCATKQFVDRVPILFHVCSCSAELKESPVDRFHRSRQAHRRRAADGASELGAGRRLPRPQSGVSRKNFAVCHTQASENSRFTVRNGRKRRKLQNLAPKALKAKDRRMNLPPSANRSPRATATAAEARNGAAERGRSTAGQSQPPGNGAATL